MAYDDEDLELNDEQDFEDESYPQSDRKYSNYDDDDYEYDDDENDDDFYEMD